MPTPVFCCGWECGQLGSVGQHFLISQGTPTISTSSPRSGARMLNSTTTAAVGAYVNTVALASSDMWVIRFYVRFNTLPSVNCDIANADDQRGSVWFKASDSKIYAGFHDSDTTPTLGATGVSVTTGVWYRIDARFNNSSPGGNCLCDVQVDGVACAQATLTATASSTSSMRMGAVNFVNTTVNMDVDDLLISNTSADYPLGAGYVNHFVPTSDGAHNVAGAADFKKGAAGVDITNATTDAYLLIDEVPLDDTTPDANDYINLIAPPNAGDYTEHKFGPAPGISTPTAGPRAVEVIFAMHQAGTGAGSMQVRLNDNGSLGTIYSIAGGIGATTIRYPRAHFADPPSAATAWHANNDGSNGDFRDLRVQFGSPPAGVDANPDQYLDAIMIEAEFATVAASKAPPPQLLRYQRQALRAYRRVTV